MFEEFVPSNVSPLVKVEVALLSELQFQQQVITTGGGKGGRGRERGQYYKRGDRKGKANDSPQIADSRLASDIPGLPSGDGERKGDRR